MTKDQFTKKLADRIRKERIRKNMSQEELADKADLYRTYIGHIENGRYSPSAYVLAKIVAALKADPRDILPTS
jgi:transcriptional regulator with XRE-family HTH domain